jgi:hypothetical protein
MGSLMKDDQITRRDALRASASIALLGGGALAFGQDGQSSSAQTVANIAASDPMAVANGLFESVMSQLTDGSTPSWQQTNAAFAAFGTVAMQVRATMMLRVRIPTK